MVLQDGILESYWGEHIHLGYYDEEERKKVRHDNIVSMRRCSLARLVFGMHVRLSLHGV